MFRRSVLSPLAVSGLLAVTACGGPEPLPPGTTGASGTPRVAFAKTQLKLRENAGEVRLPLVLSRPTDKRVTAQVWSPDGDTACTVEVGETGCEIPIALVDDALAQGDRRITYELFGATNATLGKPDRLVLVIEDDEVVPPKVTFGLESVSIVEGSAAVLQARLSFAFGREVRVPFTVAGTASRADHSLEDGEFVFPVGETSASVAFTVTDDEIDEQDETIVVTLGVSENALPGRYTVQTLTVVDDDPTPVAEFEDAARSYVESAGTGRVEVVLDRPSDREIRVPFTVGGSATQAEHGLSAGAFVLPAGETRARIDFGIVDDALDETDKTIVVTLGGATNAVTGSRRVQTITLLDDDDPPVAAFTQASQQVSESAGSGSFTVRLDAASALPVSVPLVVGGTASERDHDLVGRTLVFAPGETERTVTFGLKDDAADENDETIEISFGALVNATAGQVDTHVVTILDDDPTPLVSLVQAPTTVSEGDGEVTLAVSASGTSEYVITVPFTVGGTATEHEHDLVAGEFTIAPGSTSGTLTFRLHDDEVNEGDRTIVVTLGTPVNALPGDATTLEIVLVDDDAPPVAQFVETAQTQPEDVLAVTATVRLDRPSEFAVTITYAVSGTADAADHTLADGALTFEPGELERSITFALVDDDVYEGDETIVITLTTATNGALGAATAHTITVQENEAPITVGFAQTADQAFESDPTYTLVLTLSGKSAYPITVPFTVAGTAGPSDHDLVDGTFEFEPGETEASVVIALTGDAVYEGNETVVVTLGTPTNAAVGAGTGTFTLTLVDDQVRPALELEESVSSVAENAAGEQVIALWLRGETEQDVVVTYVVSDPTGATTLESGTVTIPGGQVSGAITYTTNDNALDGPDKTVTVTLVDVTVAELGPWRVHTVTVVDDEPTPTAAFAQASALYGELAGPTSLLLRLDLGSEHTVSVPFTVSGTTDGDDHDLVAGAFTFTPGETIASIQVTFAADDLYEGDETIVITLGEPTHAQLGTPAILTITLVDESNEPRVSLAPATQTVAEGGSVTLTATLSNPSTTEITVPFVLSGTASDDDHDLVAGTFTFAPKTTTATREVVFVADGVYEGDETLVITLGGASGATTNPLASTSTITIADDASKPELGLFIETTSIAEGGSIGFLVSLVGATLLEASVDLQVDAGPHTDRFTLSATRVTFAPGETARPVTLSLADDAAWSPPFEVTVRLVDPSGATLGLAAVVLEVTDDEPMPLVSFADASSSVDASADAATVRIVSTGPSTAPITLALEVTGGSEQARVTHVPEVVTLLPGEVEVEVELTLEPGDVDAGDPEPRTIELTISDPQGAALDAQVTHAIEITSGELP